MKKYLNLLFVLPVFLFAPLIVFGCMGFGMYVDPFLSIVLLYFLITGFIYFKTYKKLTDSKWTFWQYMIVLLITIPSLFLIYSILTTFPFFPKFMLEKTMSRLPGGTINYNLINPILAIVAFVAVFVPLIFKKGWIYKWGIPLYLLIVIILYVLYGGVLEGRSCF